MITTVRGFTLQDIMDAIDEAVATGDRVIYFPEGVNAIDGEIELFDGAGHSHLTFVGVPGQSLIRQLGVGTLVAERNIFKLNAGIEHVTFRGLAFEGPGVAANVWNRGAAILGIQVRDVLVEDCRVTKMGGAGIAFTQGDREGQVLERIIVQRCHLADNVMPGPWANNYVDISVYGACRDVTIIGNTCLGRSEDPNDTGINVYYPFGSNSQGGEPQPITNVHIVDNRCDGHRRHGIVAPYGRTIPDGVSIVNNVCRDNGWIGIYSTTMFYPEAEGDQNLVTEGRVVITGNFCSGNGASSEGHPTLRGGIFARGYDIVVSGNVCYENRAIVGARPPDLQGTGIRVTGTRLVATDNVCRHNEGDAINVWGLNTEYPQAAEQITVSANRCHHNELSGIYILGTAAQDGAFPTSGVVVVENACEANEGRGIFVDRVQGVEVTANTCRESGEAGIALWQHDRRTRVSDNVCFDNCKKDVWPHAGIFLGNQHQGSGVASGEGVVAGNTSSRAGIATFQQYGIRVDGQRPIVMGNVLLGYTGQGQAGINDASGGTAVLQGNVFDAPPQGLSELGWSVVQDPTPDPG